MKQVPLAREADSMEIPLHRTRDVNGRTSRNEIEAIEPDLVITAGFGQKLGAPLLALPARGCINIHTSLLPSYRGASPVAAALREGATRTGITLFQMDAEMDRGPILAQAPLEIGPDETRDEVTARLAELGADLLVRTLPGWLDGSLEAVPQDEEGATYVGRLTKKDGVIRWDQPARAVHDQIRSVTSWPGAQSAWQPRVRHAPLPLLVLKSAVVPEPEVAAPVPAGDDAGVATEVRAGTVLAVSKEGIDVRCAEGVLRILRVHPTGGRAMAVKDFLNARRVVAGDRFVAP